MFPGAEDLRPCRTGIGTPTVKGALVAGGPAFPKEPLMTTALLPIGGAPVVSSNAPAGPQISVLRASMAASVAGLLPFLLEPVHFLMETKMLRTIARRARP